MDRLSHILSSKSFGKVIFWGGFCLYLLTALYNVGFIAVDDYAEGIAHFIPADSTSFISLIHGDSIRNPARNLVMLSIGKLGVLMGFSHPMSHYRFILCVIALYSYLSLSFFGVRLFRLEKERDLVKENLFLFLIGFYFLCPLFFTRPLIESLAAPLLFGSAYFSCRYWEDKKVLELSISVVLLTFASMIRFQAGVCLFAILFIVILNKRYIDAVYFLVVSIVCFVLSGNIDQLIRGGFHESILRYLRANIDSSSSYGVTPFYTYVLLFLGLSFPPVFLSRFKGFLWKKNFRPLLPVLMFFIIFVLAHSLIPHKEERFMTTALPLFLVLLTPLLADLIRRSCKRRLLFFIIINSSLLLLVSFNVVQNNVLSLVSFLEGAKGIKTVKAVDDALVLFPDVFLTHRVNVERINEADLHSPVSFSCDEALVARSYIRIDEKKTGLKKISDFRPGILENLIIHLNSKRNLRRSKLSLYISEMCAPP